MRMKITSTERNRYRDAVRAEVERLWRRSIKAKDAAPTETLAARLGVSASNIRRWGNNETAPSWVEAVRIGAILQMAPVGAKS